MKIYLFCGLLFLHGSLNTMRSKLAMRFFCNQKINQFLMPTHKDPRVSIYEFIEKKVQGCPLPPGHFTKQERDSLFDGVDKTRDHCSREELAKFAYDSLHKNDEMFKAILKQHLDDNKAHQYKDVVDFIQTDDFRQWSDAKKRSYLQNSAKMYQKNLNQSALNELQEAEKRYLITKASFLYLYIHASGCPVPIYFYI